MGVYTVTATYLPNGNSRSRPFVADDATDAEQQARAEWDIADHDPEFSVTVRHDRDPEGTMERLLREAEIRRREHEFYAR